MMNNFRWETLIHDHLLTGGVITGVSLISMNASCLYSTGKLQNISQTCMSQFALLFTKVSTHQHEELCQHGLILATGHDTKPTTFHIYKSTNCSIYATAGHSRQGMLVGNVPYGVLVCTYAPPGSATKAIKYFEDFCHLLRA